MKAKVQTIAETARAGPGLAFIAIADGMQTFGDFKNVMAVLFFLTLLTLGLDSTFAWAETFVSYVDDGARLGGRPPRKLISVGCVCAVLFLFGLPYCTRMGFELLDTIDNYVGLMFLLFGVFMEGVLFVMDFGFARFITAIRTACGVDMGPVQKAYWLFTTHVTMPIVPLVIFIWDFVRSCQRPYEGYPSWMQGIGWTLLSICILLIPIGMIHSLRLHPISTLDNSPGFKLVAILPQEDGSIAADMTPNSGLAGLSDRECHLTELARQLDAKAGALAEREFAVLELEVPTTEF